MIYLKFENYYQLKVLLLCCSAPHTLLAMGKVDPQHIDLQVDPLNILRPLSKLIHQLPLVICFFMHHLLNNSYREIGFALVVKPLLSIHRSVRIHPSQGWELVLVWSSKEGEWTPQQMNRCLQIALEILLVP